MINRWMAYQIFKQMNRSSLQLTHHNSLSLVHNDAFNNINWHEQILNTVSSKILQYIHNMDVADYWLMAREYLVWNAAIA